MKYVIFTLLLLANLGAFAQDSLFLKDGSVVEGYVKSIDENQITYAKNSNQRATFKLPTQKVAYIIFEDGTRDDLTEFKVRSFARTDESLPDDSLQAYQIGRSDGFTNYKNKGVKTAAAISTFVLPPVGLATTISTSATPPEKALIDLKIVNPDYRQGYLDGALLKKRKSAWGGFGLGMGILLGVSIIAAAAAN